MLVSLPPSLLFSIVAFSPPLLIPTCNLLRFALSLCPVTLRAQPRINIPFMSQQRFIPGVFGTSQVSTEAFFCHICGLQFITMKQPRHPGVCGWDLSAGTDG